MIEILSKLKDKLDSVAERSVRRQATNSGRRSFLAKAGQAMVGMTVVPMLPYDRFGEAAAAEFEQKGDSAFSADDQQCDYWRYCALSGTLCTCCGGSVTDCPPGSDISKVSWIGTCENPDDEKSYLISYNDCCGKMSCNGCRCSNHERERPGYRLGLHNGINWCMANNKNAYHCTVAAIVGTA